MKYKYYDVDVGFFPTQVKLCFNEKDFYQVLKDHDIQPRADEGNPLAMGVAETHAFSNAKESVIIVIFNIAELEDDAAGLTGVIAHETSHVIERIMEHIGEKREDMGEETRAYLTQYIVEQTMKACLIEVKKRAKRKANRATTGKKGQSEGGPVSEVDESRDDGSAGQAGVLPGEGDSGGVERSQWKIVPQATGDDRDAKESGDRDGSLEV